jgi:hypothetical protein
MSYAETYDNLCVLLEEYADADIETVANNILGLFGLLGEDLLDALDPPPGLAHWLRSHGLSLAVTSEGRSPRVWAALEDEEESLGKKEAEPEEELEGEPSEELPLQVGEYVEYRTSPKGPRHVSEVGAGLVSEVGDGFYWVHSRGDSKGGDVYIVPDDGDVIRRVS